MEANCRKFLRRLIRLRPCNVDCRNYQALPFHGKPDEMNVGQIRGAATLQSLCRADVMIVTVEPLLTHTPQWTARAMGYERLWANRGMVNFEF